MGDFIETIFDIMAQLVGVLTSFTFEVWGLQVNYFAILIAAFVICLVMSQFWGGTRT